MSSLDVTGCPSIETIREFLVSQLGAPSAADRTIPGVQGDKVKGRTGTYRVTMPDPVRLSWVGSASTGAGVGSGADGCLCAAGATARGARAVVISGWDDSAIDMKKSSEALLVSTGCMGFGGSASATWGSGAAGAVVSITGCAAALFASMSRSGRGCGTTPVFGSAAMIGATTKSVVSSTAGTGGSAIVMATSGSASLRPTGSTGSGVSTGAGVASATTSGAGTTAGVSGSASASVGVDGCSVTVAGAVSGAGVATATSVWSSVPLGALSSLPDIMKNPAPTAAARAVEPSNIGSIGLLGFAVTVAGSEREILLVTAGATLPPSR